MSHAFDPTILREYDIRGIIGETLEADDARAIGRSFATRGRNPSGLSRPRGEVSVTTSPSETPRLSASWRPSNTGGSAASVWASAARLPRSICAASSVTTSTACTS